MPSTGCQDYIQLCIQAANGFNGGYTNGRITQKALANPAIRTVCSGALSTCVDHVEAPYYNFGDRGVYDIRVPLDSIVDGAPIDYYTAWLNKPEIQRAVGVSFNYTSGAGDVAFQFQALGDEIFPNFKSDLVNIIESGVRVALLYGDAGE